MSQIEAICVKNLRALADSGFIELKPITLLVGKNSVGKSTFARVFPLLRQSIEEQRRAPLLWWGKYVDYGTFDDAVNRWATEKSIRLAFRLRMNKPSPESVVPSGLTERGVVLSEDCVFDIELSIDKGEKNTYVSRILVSTFDLACEVLIGPDNQIRSIRSGNMNWEPSEEHIGFADAGEVIPGLGFFRGIKDASGKISYRWSEPLKSNLEAVVGVHAHGNTTPAKLSRIALAIPVGGAESSLRAIRSIRGSQTWGRSVATFTETGYWTRRLRDAALMYQLPALLRAFNQEIKIFANGVRYLEPIRATAQRYYRSQELSVSEIDSRGGNIAMFLNSLEARELNSFNSWMRTYLGMSVVSERSGGHISLKVLIDDSRTEVNIADTGFGISQVLPIAAQIWAALRGDRSRTFFGSSPVSCLVIEQPELHLHPAFQAKLADLFVASLDVNAEGSRPPRPKIVAETHSSSLVNRLGELVADKKISHREIQIVMFSQAGPDDPVSMHIAEFDDDGVLRNWPFGFFASGFSE